MRRRLLHGLLIALTGLGLLAAGLTWYLNAVFLPGPARRWIATQLAEQTGRRIQLGALHFRVWEGIAVDHVVIFEDRRYGDQPCLAVERVTLHGPLPTLQLMHPRLRLVRDAAGVWNLESLRLFHQAAAGAGQHPQPLPLLVARLVISDGELLVEDQSRKPGLDATLTRINLRAALNLPHAVALRGTAQWQTVPVTALLLQGQWNLAASSGEGSVTARQFPLDTVRPYLPAATAAALRELAGAATVTVKGAMDAHQLQVTVTATAEDTRVQWSPVAGGTPWTITGDYVVTGQGTAHPHDGWVWGPPAATVQLRHLAVPPPAPLPAVDHLDGTLQITPTAVQLDAATATVSGLPVRAHGTLTTAQPDRWPQAALAGEADADGPLAALWQAAAPYRTGWLADTQLTGAGQLHVAAAGTLQAPKVAATLSIHDARLAAPSVGTIDALNGRVRLEPNLLTAVGVRGTWRQQPVQVDGTLVNFAAPEISGTLTVGEVTADAALAVAGGQVTITELKTRYRKSQATTTGTVTLGAATTGALHTEFSLDAADGLALLPASWATLRAWQPAGRLKGEASVNGPLQDPARWETTLSAHAGEFTVRGIRLENVLLEYRQRDGAATLQPLTALVYGGTVSTTGTLRLDDPHQPFTAKVSVANLELGRLAKELAWNDQQVSGLVSGECQVSGAAGHPSGGWVVLPGSLNGQGRFQVTNGRLFEMPLLKGLADILGASALRRVVFKEAAGTYELHGDRVTTQDLTVYGDLATLTATGAVTFAGALDARVVASIDPTAFERSPQFAQTLGRFLHQAGYLIGEIKLGGTLAKPTYEVVPLSLNRVLKEQVFKKLGDMLGGIWQ